ncbi:hypothetical protein N0V95_000291 [Ascochyta clinopodiicola]|nr:hypothetical protein N0V95_000291 [Ascochyta clinopodiicola]
MSGFQAAELPRTLQDAVAIAHKMGFEWIWIDQLCILQDNLDDWSLESSRMAQVYNEGIFQECTSQIAWECNLTLYLEEGRGRQTNPAEHFAKAMFTNFFHQQRDADTLPTEGEIIHRIGNWNAVLQEMAVRELTYKTDKLPAISGLASALQIPEMGEYLAGVWSYNPFLSMAWFARWPQDPPETYQSPSWSCAWTTHQIVWHYDTWRGYDNNIPSSDAMAAWTLWDKSRGPRLLHHNMILKNLDPKGEVLPGSSLTITAHCRAIHVADIPGSDFDYNFDEVAQAIGGINEPGHRICMDEKPGSCDAVCAFEADFPGVESVFERASVREYVAVQIVRERKETSQKPKIIGLVLERVGDPAEGVFRRVGLTVFDEVGGDGAWVPRTLKLL